MTDSELLGEYVQRRSAEAFAGIVRRYVDLVYGTARRMVGDEHLAQDVAQATFLVLARKAKGVEGRRLPGWLVNATRLSAREAMRSKLCRDKHEGRAAQMRSVVVAPAGDEPTAEQMTPLLDEALGQLNETDRTAVVMRFLQGMSFPEVGAAMGSSEEAARKRVERAVEKLRAVFMKKGIVPSVGGLMVVLAAHQAQAAPVGLAGLISGTAVSGGTGASVILAKGVMKMMAWAKLKVAAACLGLLAAGGMVVVVGQIPAKPVATTAAAAPVPAELQRIYELIYLLRQADPGSKNDQWCGAIKGLVEIGKPAIPYLIAELDHTDDGNHYTRALAFTLRAIGDPRAVPALLRAIPRCRVGVSDYGIGTTDFADPTLIPFMAQNSWIGELGTGRDGHGGERKLIAWGRPIVEIDAALRKVTHHDEGDGYVRANPFGESEAEQQAVRDAYSAAAARWQKWWDENHSKLVSDRDLSTVQVPPAEAVERFAASTPAAATQPVHSSPTSPEAKIEPASPRTIPVPVRREPVAR